MSQQQINEYQEAYRKAWDAQNKIDAKINKMVLAPGQRPIQQYDTEIGRQYGKMGGRQKAQANVKLTDKAKVINNMLKHGLTTASIAGMLEVTTETVSNIEKRYGLPRDE
jgi:DNA-binding NarL/FixJ family response regulator